MAKKTKRELEKDNKYRNKAYKYICAQIVMGMFDEEAPWRKEFLEWQLINWGWGAIAKDSKGDLYVGYIAYYDIDEYGLPKEGADATFFTRHGYEFPVVIGETCVVGYNNEVRLPELLLDNFADFFSETDISLMACLKKSRVNPLPISANSKVKKAIDEAMEDVEAGNTRAITYEGAFEPIAEGMDPVTMLNLTDPAQTDKLQYLSKFHDDMLRRFMTFYGHSLSSGSKMAQVTSAELEGYTTFSRIYPYIMLKAREDWFNEVNEILQPETPLTVKFSKAWEHLNNDLVLNNEEEADNNEDSEGLSDSAGDSAEESDSE